jgi:hypothetical protein
VKQIDQTTNIKPNRDNDNNPNNNQAKGESEQENILE